MIRNDDNQTITVGRAVRIIIAVSTIIGAVSATCAAYYALREADRIADLRITAVEESQKEQAAKTAELQKVLTEMTRAVDKASVLLDRLDKKLGQP